MNNINLEEKKAKKKPYSSVTYTTGDIQKNIEHFNKMLSGKAENTHTDGYLNGTFKNSDAEAACAKVGTFASQSPDGASSISTGSDGGSGMGESFSLAEAGGKKGRKVTRYFIKPQNIWCAKKTDIINALIDNEDQDCTIYTLNNLDDNKDVTKLTANDVIYYYKDGILFDKNMVKVMDYDLYIKHEEDRDKLNIATATDAQIEKVYDDRLTGNMGESLVESQSQEIGNFYRQLSKKYNLDFDALVYGKDGFMQTCYPNGFPDFRGDVIYSEKYWNEFEKWLKETKNITLTEAAPKDIQLDLGAVIDNTTGVIKKDTINVTQKQADKYNKLQNKVSNAEFNSKTQDKAIKKLAKYTNKLHEEANEFDLYFEDVNIYGEKLAKARLQESEEEKCCICGEPIVGYGNNPEPYKSAEEGRCCDACNLHFVIPARIEKKN